MDTFVAMFSIELLFAALLIPGYLLGKVNGITDVSALSFSNILMYVAMPFWCFPSCLIEQEISSSSCKTWNQKCQK